MKKQLFSRKYWFRFFGFFIWCLIIYSIGMYFFREKDENFWTLSNFADKIGFAFFMSLFFSYQNKNEKNVSASEIVEKPTIKSFFGTYILLLLFGIIILTFMLFIGWILFSVFSTTEPFFLTYVKAVMVTAIMCLLINIYFFVTENLKYNKQQKAQDN